jgi:hypothetical protein
LTSSLPDHVLLKSEKILLNKTAKLNLFSRYSLVYVLVVNGAALFVPMTFVTTKFWQDFSKNKDKDFLDA